MSQTLNQWTMSCDRCHMWWDRLDSREGVAHAELCLGSTVEASITDANGNGATVIMPPGAELPGEEWIETGAVFWVLRGGPLDRAGPLN